MGKNEKGYTIADIPKNCEECDYARLINGEMACTAANLRRKTKKERPEWCPIQPIPEREDNDKEEKEMMKIKENTHIVIKNEDAKKFLSEEEYQVLEKMLCKIREGRIKDKKEPVNDYYICNKDEPYAEMVHGVIIGGEYQKKLDNRQKETEAENGFSDYWEEN